MLLTAAVSPWLCCCHAAPPAAATTTKQAALAKHSCCACCRQEKPEAPAAKCDHLASVPSRGCPCLAERPQVILAVSENDASSSASSAIASVSYLSPAQLSPALSTGSISEIWHFCCCRDLLATLHILRC
jgi:hypothetical protein